jgi:hypothetical protein
MQPIVGARGYVLSSAQLDSRAPGGRFTTCGHTGPGLEPQADLGIRAGFAWNEFGPAYVAAAFDPPNQDVPAQFALAVSTTEADAGRELRLYILDPGPRLRLRDTRTMDGVITSIAFDATGRMLFVGAFGDAGNYLAVYSIGPEGRLAEIQKVGPQQEGWTSLQPKDKPRYPQVAMTLAGPS